MVAVLDVLNLVVNQVLLEKPINVKDTVAEPDVSNQVVKQVPEAKLINV